VAFNLKIIRRLERTGEVLSGLKLLVNHRNWVIVAVPLDFSPFSRILKSALHCPHFTCSQHFYALHFGRWRKSPFLAFHVLERTAPNRPAGLALTATILARPLPLDRTTAEQLSLAVEQKDECEDEGNLNKQPSGWPVYSYPNKAITIHGVLSVDTQLPIPISGHSQSPSETGRHPNKQLHFDLLA